MTPYSAALIIALFSLCASVQVAAQAAKPDAATERENPSSHIPYETGRATVPERQPRWSDFLPIWGQAAREQGYVLPLPFGVSAGYMHQDQPFDVHAIEISGADFKQAGLLKIDQVQNTEGTYTLRFDTWILPFFNLYAIAGKTEGRAQGPLDLDLNPLVDAVRAQRPAIDWLCKRRSDNCQVPVQNLAVNLNYQGDVLGGGMTIAGGYKDFFGMVDINKTYTDLDISHVDAKAVVTSARIGWNGNLGVFDGSLWIGAMHQDIDQSLDLKLPTSLSFIDSISIDQSSAEPLNGIVGGRWTFTDEFEALLEFGIGERDSTMLSASYRF